MKRSICSILLSLLLIISFSIICIGCTTEKPNAATGYKCVECGDEATHFAGTGWIKSQKQNGALYLCDDCYEDMIEYAENNNRVVSEVWWE